MQILDDCNPLKEEVTDWEKEISNRLEQFKKTCQDPNLLDRKSILEDDNADFLRGIENEREQLKRFASIGVAVEDLNRRRMDIHYGLCIKISI